MAECIRYVCNHCSKDLQSWSDGNPYFINASGRKEYAYHPNHEGLARCIGNDSPHLCLQCGHGFRVDSVPHHLLPRVRSSNHQIHL